MENFKEAFYEEATDLLEQLEIRLLELEQAPNDKEIISSVFRIMHTIKGAAGMFGFDHVAKFTHSIETTMEYVRDGKVLAHVDLITITLRARDYIKELLISDNSMSDEQQQAGDTILVDFRAYVEKYRLVPSESEDAGASQSEVVENDEERCYEIYFKPASTIFLNGTNPILLLDELSSLGSIELYLDFSLLPCISTMDSEQSYLAWRIDLQSSCSVAAIQDVFIFLDSDSEINITIKDCFTNHDTTNISEDAPHSPLDSRHKQHAAINDDKKDRLIAKAIDTTPSKPVAHREIGSQTIKVASEKLDQIVDLVGELVTFNARLSQVSQNIASTSLTALVEQADRLITEIRDSTMGMRMLPLGSTFSRFHRLVRDLSQQLGKEVEMVTEGAETELDKNIIEKLSDPLVHLVRNSIDHGIELPHVREQRGKPTKGVLTLTAKHVGAFVNITISDDGSGLNHEKILAKAIKQGLISSSNAQDLSNQNISDLIFLAGFSTAEQVTDVSGRGVGMDVVKKEITALGGSVSVSSIQGKGATFTLKIPLTLAIIEGLMTKIENNYYIFPLASVEECNQFKRSQELDDHKTDFIHWRDELVPYVNLRHYFSITGQRPKLEQIIIVNDKGSHTGFVVDKIVGNFQTVIKPLGRFYRNIEGISGATILGDGTVALILDLYKLAEIISFEDHQL